MSTNAPSPISYHPTFLSGQTLDTNFAPAQQPFDIKSSPKLFNEEEFKKIPLTQNGSAEELFQLVMNPNDKLSSLGISGELDMTCGPVTRDANVKFAMDNINSGLSLSIIYRNSVTGKIQTVDLNDLDSIKFSDAVQQQIEDGLSFNDFVEAYGQYIIIGFESGGEILYDCTYSTKDSSDKVSISGGLSVAYNNVPGFNISGEVNGSFNKTDIEKSLDVKTTFLINPSSDSKEQADLINYLNELMSISQTTESQTSALVDLKNNIDAAAQAILNPTTNGDNADLNWSKAIIYPIGSIPCVSTAFPKQKIEDEQISSFLQYLNRLYVDIKSKSQDIGAMTDKWPKDAQSPLFNTYAVKFEEIIQLIETFSDYQTLSKYGKEFNEYIQGGSTSIDDKDDDTKQESKEDDILTDNKQIDIPTNEFYKIIITLLDSQYDDDIFTPFNEYMNSNDLTASLSVAVDDVITVNLSQNNGESGSYKTIINQFSGLGEAKTIDSIEISSNTVLQFVCKNNQGPAGFMALIKLSNGKQYTTPDGYFKCTSSSQSASFQPYMYCFNPKDWNVSSSVFPDNASFIWPNNDQKKDDVQTFEFKFSDIIST